MGPRFSLAIHNWEHCWRSKSSVTSTKSFKRYA